MTPLRQRMLDAMVVRGFSPRTQESYADAIYGMAKHYRRDPAEYSAREVEAYLLHMVQERHLSYSTMNQAACAARFLYERVLGRERELFPIAMAKVPAKQPELLAREEISRLFACCSHPVHRMLLQTLYAAGLRVSEACALRVGDIDSHSDRMCIRVACGKGEPNSWRRWLARTVMTAPRVTPKGKTRFGASGAGNSTNMIGWCMPRRRWEARPRCWSTLAATRTARRSAMNGFALSVSARWRSRCAATAGAANNWSDCRALSLCADSCCMSCQQG